MRNQIIKFSSDSEQTNYCENALRCLSSSKCNIKNIIFIELIPPDTLTYYWRFSAIKREWTEKSDSPALCWDLTNRVALSIHTIRQPVTFGSSVPLWPVFSTRRMRLIHATTSWEDGFAGLSKLIKPDLDRKIKKSCSQKYTKISIHD